MDKFLDKLQKVTQKETKQLNRCITNEETELVIKTLLTKKRKGPNDFTGGFYQTFKESIQILQNLLKYRQGGSTSQLIQEGQFQLLSKAGKDTTRNYILINIPYEYQCKNPL